eukprot:6207776-Lingulodinium_polyedra.AAC.1
MARVDVAPARKPTENLSAFRGVGIVYINRFFSTEPADSNSKRDSAICFAVPGVLPAWRCRH